MSKPQKSRLLPVLISLVILCLTSEVFTYLIMEMEINGLLTRAATQEQLEKENSSDKIVLEIQTDTHGTNILHPYWGFALNRDKLQDINQLGLSGPKPPEEASDKRLVVAVLGGSVARELADYKESLIEKLQSVPRFREKEILILPYALFGGKQPQQLFQVTYLLALGYHFDLIINLDGFNELTLPYVDNMQYNVAGSYPRNWRLYSRLGLDATLSALMYRASMLEAEKRALHSVFGGGPLKTLNTSLFIYNLINQSKDRQFKEINGEIQKFVANESPTFQTSGPFVKPDSFEDAAVKMTDLWIKSSVQLQQICQANQIQYYHFLQPNQYLPGSKLLSEEEQRIAIRTDHPYGQIAAKGYHYLIEGGKTIAAEGVNFTDLTLLFKNESSIVYKDSCCHFNKLGNSLMIARIAEVIGKTNSTSLE